MGVDAQMVVATPEWLDDDALRRLSYETVAAFGTESLWVRRGDDFGGPRHALSRGTDYELIPAVAAKTTFTVHLWTRFYGPGYERGDLPLILNLARWFRSKLDGCTVYYGGDSGEALLELTPVEGEGELWQHYVDNQHLPYTKGWDRMTHDGISLPECELCQEPVIRNGWGNGGQFAAAYCPGCGWNIETRDAGRSWAEPVKAKG